LNILDIEISYYSTVVPLGIHVVFGRQYCTTTDGEYDGQRQFIIEYCLWWFGL